MDTVITCLTCGAIKSIDNIANTSLNDVEVLALAGHTPDCPLLFPSATTIISQDNGQNTPTARFYSIRGAS